MHRVGSCGEMACRASSGERDIVHFKLHAHEKAAGAHVIKLRCFKNIRALRNKEAGPAMHDCRAVGTRKGENELGFRSVMRLWVPSNDQAI